MAEATFQRILSGFAPNYELRFKAKTQGGGLDCRVWPTAKYKLSDKIGSLAIDPQGNIVYAPQHVKWLLSKEVFKPATPAQPKLILSVAEWDNKFRKRWRVKVYHDDVCSVCGVHIPADDFLTMWATYKLVIDNEHPKGVQTPFCYKHGTMRKGNYEEHLAAGGLNGRSEQ
jgi:hypothetical protein